MATIPEGYKEDSSGALRPISSIKQIDLLRDELVNKIAAQAAVLHQQIKQFKETTLAEIEAFIELSAQEYGVEMGGEKGNVQLNSYNGQYRVMRANHDAMSFDERLLVARDLMDECVRDWCSRPGVPDGLVAIVNRAFRRNAQGQISVSRVLDLRSYDIDDVRWKRAMEIITDSIQVHASITYLRVYERVAKGEHGRSDQYKQMPLDIAGA